ncbi:MAG: PEP/pyruvate-binding domain-containing protein [Candidatus Methanofastidiosa archaeon]|nr:PEP/pyruvate-binding domain-containing protein [Candidatus Methanofastidiosa archaeon]
MVGKYSFYTYAIDVRDLPEGVTAYGDGYVGGKAKGLIMSMMAYQTGLVNGAYADHVNFPPTYILCSGYFDQFMRLNKLDRYVARHVKGGVDPTELARRFMEGELQWKLKEVLYDILQHEKGPLIVRSSSFLEDSLDYSFAGIYESVFIANSGTLEHRLESLQQAIRTVYLSTFKENAIGYRRKHKIPLSSEKMSIVIQRVVGHHHTESLFFPLMAGVAFSRNYYPWNERIRMEDGVGRLVIGLGTRAVGRDYARVFSLSNPRLRPEGSVVDEIVRYSQTKIDAIDMTSDELVTLDLAHIKNAIHNVQLVASVLKEGQYLTKADRHIPEEDVLIPSFDALLSSDASLPFVPLVSDILTSLEALFEVPVDIEFVLDLEEGGSPQSAFSLVQVRPLASRPENKKVAVPRIRKEDIIIHSKNALGNGLKYNIPHIVYVPPASFSAERSPAIAREIGAINTTMHNDRYILVGPGRWGTSILSQGIPVIYGEISNAAVIVEYSLGATAPELSYGTHFFGDISATNTLYIPVFLDKGDEIDTAYLDSAPAQGSELVRLISSEQGFKACVNGDRKIGIVARQEPKKSRNGGPTAI